MIIGLTGSLGAGKDTILEYLESQGFNYFTFSNILREEAKNRNMELTRKNLQDLGNNLRKKHGAGILAQRLLQKINLKERNIVNGIRNPAEIEELKKNNSFFLVAVDAPAQLRFSRLVSRDREMDPKTWEEFLKVEARDKGEGEKEHGQQVAACMEMADFNICNDGDIGAVHEQIKKILGQIQDIIIQNS